MATDGKTSPVSQVLRWYACDSESLSQELETHAQRGLTEDQARQRLKQYGQNALPETPPPSLLSLFFSQFSSLIIWVLIGAAVVSGLLQEWIDAFAILAIVLLNAVLGFVQEYRAERSLAALKKLSIATALVIRNGSARTIPAHDLVPGDLIQLEAGDHIPADARLVYATGFRTQEAALTGESTAVNKHADPFPNQDLPLADRHNMVFLGTQVIAGKGRALVVSTGKATELGAIASLLQGEEIQTTPLQKRLEQLGHLLLYLSLGIVVVVFLLGLMRGIPLGLMFLTSVSLAVAAIPEGLPAIVTVTLALGVTKMVKRHALIRRLPAVETLGSTTVICTDKTGTLTKNEMTVVRLFIDGRILSVTGEGYAPEGTITSWNQEQTFPKGGVDFLKASVLCNGAQLQREEGGWSIQGDPTEGALLVAAEKMSFQKSELEHHANFLGEVPFDPERKMMTIVREEADEVIAFVKGAPDILLQRCTQYETIDGSVAPLGSEIRANILEVTAGFAGEALRVLAVARRPLDARPSEFHATEIEQSLIFLGLAAMKDPLRPEAKIAVEACAQAGIRTVMITGDHKDTALAIGRELGILKDGYQALSGHELNGITEEQLVEQVGRVAVFARVSAEHKLRIVKAWKKRGAIVAMTGDGVNDAPAVKAADIGVAMGQTGTDVTKEASAMVVTDDNFASIAAAVEEGRAIYDNILKAVHFLLSCNISEVFVMFFATLLGFPLPLMPVQILWINLVTDGFPALALAVDPKAPDLMERKPRSPLANILEKDRMILMFVQGLFMAAVAMGVFFLTLYGLNQDIAQARTVTFSTLVVAQLGHAFNCRSHRYSIVNLGWTSNPHLLLAVALSALLQMVIISFEPLGLVFKTEPLPLLDWGIIVGGGLCPVLAMEIWKAIQGRKYRL